MNGRIVGNRTHCPECHREVMQAELVKRQMVTRVTTAHARGNLTHIHDIDYKTFTLVEMCVYCDHAISAWEQRRRRQSLMLWLGGGLAGYCWLAYGLEGLFLAAALVALVVYLQRPSKTQLVTKGGER